MAQRTYTAKVIVLKKTKLGESDLILTFLAEDGQQIRAVAKGARKPTSPFASRLELFSCADVLLASGRNLDIVKEARFIEGYGPLRDDYDLSVAAAPMVDLLARITESNLVSPKLFPLTQAAFSALCTPGCRHEALLCVGFMLKALSFSGFRPSFDICTVCGCDLDLNEESNVAFSYESGGALCDPCAQSEESVLLSAGIIKWAHALLFARFSDIMHYDCDERTKYELLLFCQQWTRYHVGVNLKSISFYLANGNL